MVFVKQLMTGGLQHYMHLRNSLQVSTLHPCCGQYGAFLMAGSSLFYPCVSFSVKKIFNSKHSSPKTDEEQDSIKMILDGDCP